MIKKNKIKHIKIKLCFIIFMSIGLTGLQAQETVSTTGGNASGSGGSVSYTIGQVNYTTYTGTTGSLAQGVQQPFEISIITGINDLNGIDLLISAYPNPTIKYLKLKVETEQLKDLNYLLYNMDGKILENKKIEDNITNINMNNYVPSIYFLKVMQGNTVVKTFKIIKIL